MIKEYEFKTLIDISEIAAIYESSTWMSTYMAYTTHIVFKGGGEIEIFGRGEKVRKDWLEFKSVL